MGNADPGLHATGRFHSTATNDDDGVADAIERYVLRNDECGVMNDEYDAA
jgi:hydroxymethylpyrimidine pyrophosphatase-like HAD family hydrolase